jgi:hypothetical protein
VVDNLYWPPKLYYYNVLAVFYSYDNKECVRAKHIKIKISFVLWKEKIQGQIISPEKVSTCGTPNQKTYRPVRLENYNRMSFLVVYDLWILRAQN